MRKLHSSWDHLSARSKLSLLLILFVVVVLPVAYIFTERQVNLFGRAAEIDGTFAGPQNLTVRVGDGKVESSWQPPTTEVGITIIDYRLEYKLASATSWSVFNDGISTANSISVNIDTNQSPVTSFESRVRAIASNGQVSEPSNISTYTIGVIKQDPFKSTGQFQVKEAEVIYSHAQRNAKGLTMWPDGAIGVVPLGQSTYQFYGVPAKTTGTLSDPASTVQNANLKVESLKEAADYDAVGGSIYRDTATGHLLNFYHSEIHIGGSWQEFYASIGVAISKDGGNTFRDTGRIIKHNQTLNSPNKQGPREITGGPFIIRDGYFYVYYREMLENGSSNYLAVARAPVSQVLAAAENYETVTWVKYYNGSFSQPALGGMSSPLESINASLSWIDVAYSSSLKKYILVATTGWPRGQGINYIDILTSDDAIVWGHRERVASSSSLIFYPTIISTGSDPKVIDKEFYVYSIAGTPWADTRLERRLITIVPSAPLSTPPVSQTPTITPSPTSGAQAGNTFSLKQSPGPQVAMPISLSGQSGVISTSLRRNGQVVSNIRDYIFTWTIADSDIAQITPTTNYLKIVAKREGSTTIKVVVHQKSTNKAVASTSYQLRVFAMSTSAVLISTTPSRILPTQNTNIRPTVFPTEKAQVSGEVENKNEKVLIVENKKLTASPTVSARIKKSNREVSRDIIQSDNRRSWISNFFSWISDLFK